jgi:ATP-dependent RNA helicase RhlE
MITMHQNKLMENTKTFDNFAELTHIHKILQENLKKLEFSYMTPIQKYSIHHIEEGFDLMGCAHTGSGKTIAFLLPIVNKMLNEGPPNDSGISKN